MSKKRDPEKVLAELGRILRSGRVETFIKPGKTHDAPRRMRIVGSRGADYAVTDAHPLDYYLKVAEARFNAEQGKLCRVVELPARQRKAVKANVKAGEENKRRVLVLAADAAYITKGSGMAGAIASAVGLSPSQVRKILAAEKKNAHD